MMNLMPYNHGRLGMLSPFAWDPARIFSDALSWNPFSGTATPIQLNSDDDHVYLSVDLPGVDASDVDMTFDHNALAIAARRGEQAYRYTVQLGDAVDPSTIEAQLDKGVLMIKAAKRPEAKPRRIPLRGTTTRTLESGASK